MACVPVQGRETVDQNVAQLFELPTAVDVGRRQALLHVGDPRLEGGEPGLEIHQLRREPLQHVQARTVHTGTLGVSEFIVIVVLIIVVVAIVILLFAAVSNSGGNRQKGH